MTYELYLRHYGRDGGLKNAHIAPLWARFTDHVNGDEPLVFGLNADHPAVNNAEELDILEVLLRNRQLGIRDFTRAFVGILRHWNLETDDDGLTFWQLTAPEKRHVLRFRHVLWPAGTNRRSDYRNVAAETIMKEVVQYNCTADASTTNGRQRGGDLNAGMGYDIAIAADQGRGNNLSLAFQGGNVLDILGRVAEQGGGDFDLAWQGGDGWQFEFYPGQLGEDKSAGADRVLLTLANRALSRARLQRSGAGATVAVAGGQGEGAARAISVVEGPDYAPDYDIEMFVDARNESTAEGREFRAGLRLEEARIRKDLAFDVLQTGDIFYSPVPVAGRKTYRAGDVVLVRFGGEVQARKIVKLMAEWRVPGSEEAFRVRVETVEVAGA